MNECVDMISNLMDSAGEAHMRILVVEDNEKVAGFIVKGLREESYSVDHSLSGVEGLDLAGTVDYDAAILDVMLPDINGLAVLKEMRKLHIATPVLILTAKDSVSDKVDGLDAGADDYLTKPFAFDELLARVRALLRRGSQSSGDTTLRLADLAVDLATRVVTRGETSIDLTRKEFALLSFLLRNAGRVMTRSTILDHVWDIQYDSGTNIVDVLIRYLRRKIDDDYAPKLIQTVRGVGYVMKVVEP